MILEDSRLIEHVRRIYKLYKDPCLLQRARNQAIEILLKVEKIGIAITPRIITFNQRVSGR